MKEEQDVQKLKEATHATDVTILSICMYPQYLYSIIFEFENQG